MARISGKFKYAGRNSFLYQKRKGLSIKNPLRILSENFLKFAFGAISS